jgi:hypothetical protein
MVTRRPRRPSSPARFTLVAAGTPGSISAAVTAIAVAVLAILFAVYAFSGCGEACPLSLLRARRQAGHRAGSPHQLPGRVLEEHLLIPMDGVSDRQELVQTIHSVTAA